LKNIFLGFHQLIQKQFPQTPSSVSSECIKAKSHGGGDLPDEQDVIVANQNHC
jgi:hypothetical protein